jgi:hypothetical protein
VIRGIGTRTREYTCVEETRVSPPSESHFMSIQFQATAAISAELATQSPFFWPGAKGTMMPKVLNPGHIKPDRAPGVMQCNFTLDKAAYAVLQEHAPGPKLYGRFLSRLLYEHAARQEGRKQVQEHLATLVGEEVSTIG